MSSNYWNDKFTVDFQSSLEIDLVTLVKIINGLQFLGGIYTGEPVLFLLSIFVLKIGRTTFNQPIICMSKLVWPFNFDLITLIPIWFIYFLQGVSCLISAHLDIWHHLIYQPTKTAYQQKYMYAVNKWFSFHKGKIFFASRLLWFCAQVKNMEACSNDQLSIKKQRSLTGSVAEKKVW